MNTTVKETLPYDNCMDLKDVDTASTIADFIDDSDFSEKTPSYKTLPKVPDGSFKNIYISFRNQDDLHEFANIIDQDILAGMPLVDIWYPEKTLISQAYGEFETRHAYVGEKKKKIKKNSNRPPVDKEWKKLWVGMPEYKQEENEPYFKITMKFRDAEAYESFGKLISQNLSVDTTSIWYPKLDRDANARKRWIEPKGQYTNPQYPVYIVSKGRADSRLTAKSFERMNMPYYIAIEPQDYDSYAAVIDSKKILVLPFSNHGDGPGRARNWCWDHAISLGAKRHWVLDDNISDFYRLHENYRVRVESGAIFKAAEDFVDRFENVPIAGFQYRFFIAPNAKYPPYVTNTRIYSTLLIDNDCPYRWRGRYNEDTDICLRVLKDGLCTIQFNSFLQGKAQTQTLAGGNTSEFYAAEGTDSKSEMLYRMHPDVTTKVIRFGRHHHFVDYNQFKKNKLILRKDAQVSERIDNYGMELITDFKE